MNESPHLRLLLSHSANFSNLEGEDLSAVEIALRQATYELVPPTLLAGWTVKDVPLLRLAGPPVSFVQLVPGSPEWTVGSRVEYILQQAQLIDPTFTLAATTGHQCEMCTSTKHCDSTCKDLVTAAGAPVTVSTTHDGEIYTAKLSFSLEWESEPTPGGSGFGQSN